MAAHFRGRRRPGPWYGRETERLLFERGTATAFPTLRRLPRARGRTVEWRYRVTIDVPYYEARTVEVRFEPQTRNQPHLHVDGPLESPHRYVDCSPRCLCMWYPADPRDERWMFTDGLVALLGLARLHLAREAYWRETRGDWPGPQAAHGAALARPIGGERDG